MQLTSIGELFVTRTLQLNNKNPTQVRVAIGKPQQFPDGQDFYCPYQITGLGDEEVNWTGGIDEIQALLLALERVGFILSDSEEYKQGNLLWIGSENNNLGFPHFDSAQMLNKCMKSVD